MSNATTTEPNIAALAEQLALGARRTRQEAAHELGLYAKEHPQELVAYCDTFVDALSRPEAQTRWECLDILSELLPLSFDAAAQGFEGAENGLFDDTSSPVRLAAFKFLCRYGQTSPAASDTAWPLLNEGIACYHGDPEYHDILKSLCEFAGGNLSEKTRAALVARMSFDAESGFGYIKSFSQEILNKAQA